LTGHDHVRRLDVPAPVVPSRPQFGLRIDGQQGPELGSRLGRSVHGCIQSKVGRQLASSSVEIVQHAAPEADAIRMHTAYLLSTHVAGPLPTTDGGIDNHQEGDSISGL
jgi:hypothetical protein